MSNGISTVPAKLGFKVVCEPEEFGRLRELEDRRLYLYGEIESLDYEERGLYSGVSTTSRLVEKIFDFNRWDEEIPPEERDPVRLYINSPGGEVTEGFALLSAIKMSKTPIYTINVGEWCSMAFLIGIVGHKRFSLPYMTFLLHEGSVFASGSSSKAEDKISFERRFKDTVIKRLVLEHSKMTEEEYVAHERDEFYMLAEDALKMGFIDEIVTDIDAIL